MPRVYFKRENIAVEVQPGNTVLQASRQAGVLIESPCNGVGTCGKCKVKALGKAEKSIQCGRTRFALSPKEAAAGFVLACQTKIYGDTDIETPELSRQNATIKILSEGESFTYGVDSPVKKIYDGRSTAVFFGNERIGEEEGDTEALSYGVVVDIGTTTLVSALIRLGDGAELTTVSALNPQSIHAQDVLSRIHIASSEKGLELLYRAVVDEINRMIAKLADTAGISRSNIYEVVYSGNTAMIHLACNVNPKPLGRYPYKPVVTGGTELPASDLAISPYGRIYIPPVISAYVGPDITSGVLATQLHKRSGTVLFIDIGTNGEMVLARDGVLAATSTAAGPAFEGMNIQCGMRAGRGAIESFLLTAEGKAEIGVIGGGKAVGICGSGLLDIVGELVSAGVIDARGRFVPPERAGYPEPLKAFMQQCEGKPVFYITPDVFLTQQDIRQVQLAKGAIRAGAEVLLQMLGITADEVDELQIAGSFGYHLRAESLIRIGMLPQALEEKIRFVGNTSKTGGKAFLLNSGFRNEMKETAKKIANIELADTEGFKNLFVKSLGF